MTEKLSSVMDRIRQAAAVHSAEDHWEHQAEDMRQATAQLVRDARTRARSSAGIPPRVLALLEAVQPTAPIAKAREFVTSERTLLVLAGGTGCGKTVAACVALDEYMTMDGWTVRRVGRLVKAIDLVRAGTFQPEFWEELSTVAMLVVDDLGTEPLDEKGWALANIAALIDKRYDACLKTILTTNLDAAKFKVRYCAADGGRLVDRLREAGAFVEFDGKSMRAAP